MKLADLPERLDRLDYPATKERVVDAYGNVAVRYANGERTLGDLLSESSMEEYDSLDDLLTDVQNVHPRDAVGEPFQSEGEG